MEGPEDDGASYQVHVGYKFLKCMEWELERDVRGTWGDTVCSYLSHLFFFGISYIHGVNLSNLITHNRPNVSLTVTIWPRGSWEFLSILCCWGWTPDSQNICLFPLAQIPGFAFQDTYRPLAGSEPNVIKMARSVLRTTLQASRTKSRLLNPKKNSGLRWIDVRDKGSQMWHATNQPCCQRRFQQF